MDILFKSRKLQKQCSDDREALKAFGESRAKRLRQRLDDLRAAKNLEVMKTLPGRIHALREDREGQLALALDGPYRLILEPVLSPEPESDNPVPWSDITCVRVLGIEDYYIMPEVTLHNEYDPTSVSPPGETLRELLEEREISQTELAERTGRPRKTINEIIKGKTAITPETALQLELALGTPASFWNTRETRYREYIARQEERERLASSIEWARCFPIREMTSRGWLPKADTAAEQVHALLEFFGVASPEQWDAIQSKNQIAFRKSEAYEVDHHALAAWLQVGVRSAERRPCSDYDRDLFRSCLSEIRDLTPEPPSVFQPSLESLCSQAGVAVEFVPQLKGCRAHGSTRWLSPRRALIQLSLRYRSDDQLWFTFFHEAAHILLHRKKDIFLEFDDHGDATKEEEEEEEANRFAADFLIPPRDFKRIKEWSVYSKAAISQFAKEIGVSPGIVVGRLQHEGLLPYSHCNELKVRFKWENE